MARRSIPARPFRQSRPLRTLNIKDDDWYSYLVSFDLLDASSGDRDRVNTMMEDKFKGDKQGVSTTWIILHASQETRTVADDLCTELQRLFRSGELSIFAAKLLVTRVTSEGRDKNLSSPADQI